MSNVPAIRTHLLAVILLTIGPTLRADDKPAAPDGYTMVPVKSGDTTTYVKVKKELDPYQNVASSRSDKYDPTSLDFNKASPMGDKEFAGTSSTFSKTATISNDREQGTFPTKPYADASAPPAHSMPNMNTKVSTPSSGAFTRTAPGFQKSFMTGGSTDNGQNKAAVLPPSQVTSEQDRTAVLGTGKTDTYASAMASKQYLGPGAQNVPKGENVKENVVLASGELSSLSDLPNRPLSVDEVRNLINHGIKPDLDNKLEAPSKALNDPDYKPEPSPAPPPADDDKSDPIPPPGMMAVPQPPENTEPLPQH